MLFHQMQLMVCAALGPSRTALSIPGFSRRETPAAALTRAPAFTAGSPA
jgi:hypothetical protein